MTIYGLGDGGKAVLREGSLSVNPRPGDSGGLCPNEPWDDGNCCPLWRGLSLITIQYA